MVGPSDSGFDPSTNLVCEEFRIDSVVARFLEKKIKASKTDAFSQGVSVYLGVTVRNLCPVAPFSIT